MHIYAYLDESGDLGTKEKSPKNFVIGILTVKNNKAVANIIKHVRQRKLKKAYKRSGELKFNKSDEIVRNAVLSRLANQDVKIDYVVLEKAQLYDYLKNKKNVVYNYLTGFLLEKVLHPEGRVSKLSFIIDRSLSRSNREALDNYVKQTIRKKLKSPPKIEITHRNSQEDRCLQVTDFVVGAVFQKVEFGREEYYKLIEGKVGSGIKLFK